ncbi:DUF4249 family protein [Tenacibaculum maritimum]|uniref:DUF4249 family protein n=2 Tax=Tenacibaculum maritimum TaxID=107401 RepID=UPI0010A49746|nr:DUF4249 family protein [Tenacibaculum maritimum]QCD63292.1 hypothetical protein B9C57_12515 [Tenacibaculum maritimum]CAA0201068.1 Probable lipoprotein precursor [Tenacibaculum maritimum]CAA0209110.1 Probable lipoprotein precursor [Tenacibaculum maritimum]
MKNFMKLFFLKSLLLFSCTEKRVTRIEVEVIEKKALVGEINQMDTIKVSLSSTGSLISGMPFTPIEKASLTVSNDAGATINNFIINSEKKWKATKLPAIKAGELYEIKAVVEGEKLSAVARIPLPISSKLIKIEKREKDFLVDVEITNPNNDRALCIISLLSKEFYINDIGAVINEKKYKRIPVSTADENTDNVKYSEIRLPYDRIFIPLEKKSTKILRMYVEEFFIDSYNVNYFLWVKSLDSKYYKYMYNYKLQEEQYAFEDNFTVPLEGNITGGLGVWGACYKVEIPVTF